MRNPRSSFGCWSSAGLLVLFMGGSFVERLCPTLGRDASVVCLQAARARPVALESLRCWPSHHAAASGRGDRPVANVQIASTAGRTAMAASR